MDYVPTLDRLRCSQRTLKLSVPMMIVRAEHVGITDRRDTKTVLSVNSERLETEEPLDNSLKHEQTRVVRRSLEALTSSAQRSPSQILENLFAGAGS